MPIEPDTHVPQPEPAEAAPPQPEPSPQPSPPQPSPPQPSPPQPSPPQPPARTSVLAIVALVSAFFVGIAGVVCGIVALIQVKRTGERGRGLAIAGIVVGGVQTVTVALVTVAIVAAAAITASSLSRAIDEAVPSPRAGSVSAECAGLLAAVETSSTAVQDSALGFADDPAAAVTAMSGLARQLEAAGAQVRDPELADAVDDAVAELDDFAAYLSTVGDDPAATAGSLAEAGTRLQALADALRGIQTACTPAA